MKEVMNAKIKHREGYRPFAPAVLAEHFSDYFISKEPHQPYMLEAPQCTPKAIQKVPAVCHVDGSARAMTVSKETGKLTGILRSYYKKTNVPVLINTSFNDNNEPICFTKLDALCCFLRCNADMLVLENNVLERQQIKNSKNLYKYAKKVQKRFQKKYFTKALQELTRITSQQEKSLFCFLKYNIKLSQFYQNERMNKKLLDFIFFRNPQKIIWMDEYHKDVLEQISKLLGFSMQKYCPKVKIVDDNAMALKKITSNDDFILYNASGFCFERSLKKNHQQSLQSGSFYGLNDKKITGPNPKSFFQKETNQAVLMQSYEADVTKTIDNFFKTLKEV